MEIKLQTQRLRVRKMVLLLGSCMRAASTERLFSIKS